MSSLNWDWRTNDAFKSCAYCGNIVKHGSGWITIGLCEEHERIWSEDIASGFKQNRLRDIMIARGEITETNDIKIIPDERLQIADSSGMSVSKSRM